MKHNDCQVFAFMNNDFLSPNPLSLHDFGIEYRQNEPYHFDNNNRGDYNGYLFQYTLEGHGIYKTNDKIVKLEKNMAFLIPFPHKSSYHLDNNSYWKFFYIHFDGTVVKQFYEQIYSKHGNILTLNKSNDTIRLLLDEYESIKRGKKYKKYEAGAFLYNFLSCLLRDCENFGIGTKTITEKGMEWIERNYASEHSLSEMCTELGITLSHFSRQFTEKYGINPVAYLTRIRLEHSLQLLLNTNMTIQEIATTCGFNNGNYYAKVFKKVLNVSPSEYRQQHGM